LQRHGSVLVPDLANADVVPVHDLKSGRGVGSRMPAAGQTTQNRPMC